MSALSIILQALGLMMVLYWLVGLIIFAFFAKVYVHPGAPLSAKIVTVLLASALLPWDVMTQGRVPRVMIAPKNPSPAAQRIISEWMAANTDCDCPACRRRRGEIE